MRAPTLRGCRTAALVTLAVTLMVTVTAWAAISVDVTTFKNPTTAAKTVSTSAFSTSAGNELLLAFISADSTTTPNTTVTQVAGAGLTWVLVQRTNVQKGTAEIWRAFAASPLSAVTVTATLSQTVDSSITVMTFNGVNTSGTNGSGAVGAVGTGNADPGAPKATLITEGNGSLVLGVGNDWDNAIARTPGTGQAIINQDLAPVADTYWVQMQSSPVMLSGTSVTINDTAPTGDRYNLSIVEVLAAAGGGTTGSISGTITPASSGATVTLSQNGTTVATTSVVSGAYSFNSVANGTYTVTPSQTGFAFNPTSQSVTVNGNSVTVPVFTATAVTYVITGTVSASGNGATMTLSQNGTTVATATVVSGGYTFNKIANGTYTVTPTEAGYSFSPPSQSVTVNSGPATVPLFTATAVTYTVTGSVSPASGNGATVTLSQNGTTVATATVVSGGYTFNNIANGTYTVTPTESGYSFSPPSQSVTVSGGPATVPVFTATALVYTVTGSVSPASIGNGATVTLTQSGTTVSTATVASGGYTFNNIANGTYTVTPSEAGYSFTPITQNVTVNGGPATVPVFTVAATGPGSAISGAITPAASGSGTTITLTQGGSTVGTATADTNGNYSFASLSNGTYTLTPAKTSFTFSPVNQTVTVNGSNVIAGPFTATSYSGQLEFPDLSDIIPTADISVVGSGSSAEFQYTHDTYNGGPGPLVIQPAYNAASGNYQGTQYIYSLSSSGNWTVTQTIRVAGDFVFDSAHGHFHFPFTTYGLYTVGANGGPGTPVATSGKISFCINDSFIYNSSLPHAGALGNLGSCSDPTSLRGLDIGAVDEYDQTDDGQSISIAGVPNGTYWLRAIVDPDNYLAEASKANNETDVELTINGDVVTILKTVTPVLPAPPSISVNSPADGTTVSGTVQLTASTATTSGVQFLIDGTPLGSLLSTSPYTLTWDTTTATNGSHWLAAQTTGPTGVIGTSAVVAVTVSNTSSTPPTVQITAPDAGATVSATVTVAANVASSEGIASVTFYVDGTEIGTPITAPPYMTTWDTETSTAGAHQLTASATDITGNTGTSAAVSVTVDNSHPPNVIGLDAKESVDGSGTMTSPALTTSQDGELLIAFVSYDGPQSSPQTATVSSAGLTWTLVKRSNHQSGTAEIWMAYASDAPETISATAQPGVGTTYHGSLTVIAFTNASGPGIVNQASAPSGAPDIYLPGVSAGNWVFAVGNDWDKAIARTPVSGQVIVHQRVDTQVGDTYWVQSTTAPSTANALVDIHDSAPTTDQWNYAAVEIVATLQ